MKIQSDGGMIDVQVGQEEIVKAIAEGRRIELTMKAVVEYAYNDDEDGTQSFVLKVTEVVVAA